MSFSAYSALSLLALASTQVSALAIPEKRTAYSFNELVAFGDDFSDNGNGSYAHGISGNPENVYGFGTWTDGPVAVSYLADLLGVPLTDYAFGGCCGGSNFGATINNFYTNAQAKIDDKPVPSVHGQIFANYTANGAPENIANSMQFIWTGQYDMMEHTDVFWAEDPMNTDFANNISSRILYNAEYLIETGAPYVFVANIYPKHKAPVTTTFMCKDGSCIEGFGEVIQAANTAIETALKGSKYAGQLIYYDAFSFMMDLMENKDSYGLTQSLTAFCDGDSDDSWSTCAAGSYVWEGATHFFWMNFIQPTTTVHQFIAQDMKKTIDSFLGV